MAGLRHSDIRKKIVEIFDKAEESLQLDTYKHRLIVDRIDIGERIHESGSASNVYGEEMDYNFYHWDTRVYFKIVGDRKPEFISTKERDNFRARYPSFEIHVSYYPDCDEFSFTVPSLPHDDEHRFEDLTPEWILKYMLICHLDTERKQSTRPAGLRVLEED